MTLTMARESTVRRCVFNRPGLPKNGRRATHASERAGMAPWGRDIHRRGESIHHSVPSRVFFGKIRGWVNP